MSLLLDTHIFLFFINGNPNLSNDKLSLINAAKKSISIASIWEIVIKTDIGRLKLKDDINSIYQILERNEIDILQLEKLHFETYLKLPSIHKDPFDSLIISQAIAEDLTLVTDDQYIKNYPNVKLL